MNPSAPNKRRERDHDESLLDSAQGSPPGSNGSAATTNFRNVSACNRCRNRKNRCDQRLPRCTGCEKANVKCVGFDPVSKREIPRSYVYYLETRLHSLESLLRANNIPVPPPSDDFSISDAIKPGYNVPFPALEDGEKPPDAATAVNDIGSTLDPALREEEKDGKFEKMVNNVGMVSVQGASDPRHLGPMSGIPFARVVHAAVKSSVSQTPSEKAGVKPSKQISSSTASGGSGSDSFFGLNTKPAAKAAPFPDKMEGSSLVDLYFGYANPQIPILHRGEFTDLFDRVYATDPKKRGPRELYLLNIVFAIGSGIIMDSPHAQADARESSDAGDIPPNRKRQRLTGERRQPEEYHAAAIMCLDNFMASTPASDVAFGGMEELQAVLLLAGLALLRPVAPGLWYIIGVAVRLGVDLGLHFEDIDHDIDNQAYHEPGEVASRSTGRKQWSRDLRRRLWWCVYSFDRLVSTCVGRPVGITDEVVTTEFPSLLDDRYITPSGFLRPPSAVEAPSYKFVAHHYFRLRLLQSEILQVLQHRQAEQSRASGANHDNEFMYTELPSPFLVKFQSFRDWRLDVDKRLWEWKESAPQKADTGVAFTPLFLELNYWQAIIMLYRQSLSVPEPLASELSPATGVEVQTPESTGTELKEDEEMVFMKVAQAGQTVLKIYRQLHRLKLVNYTFLATHHLFMSGISFLYAIWHSPLVRSQLTLDDVDFTILIATSVLTDLMDKCPPAEACRDAFMRMSKATITMCMSTTGFGNASTLGSQPLNSPGGYFSGRGGVQSTTSPTAAPARPRRPRAQMQMPQFDMNLKDLLSDEEIANRPLTYQPKLPNFGGGGGGAAGGRANSRGAAFDAPEPPPRVKTERTSLSQSSPQSSVSATQYPAPSGGGGGGGTSYQVSSQPAAYPAFSDAVPPDGAADFSADDLGFLNTFPSGDANNAWPNGGDLDMGFGTGGMAFDGNGAWEANGGVDLFDGFFFGNPGNG